MDKIRLLLVEDRDVIRDCLRMLIEPSNKIRVVAEASDGLEALYLEQNIEYDVILMDYSMPRMNGLQALESILKTNPTVKILMFSFLINPFEIKKFLAAGAMGYLLKDSEIKDSEKAIISVHEGKKFLCDKTKQLLTIIKYPIRA